MAYKFQAIDISFFDFHMMIDPLINPASIKSDFSFLVDPPAYNQQYLSAVTVQTPAMDITPLKWRFLNYHHFWKYYQTIWSNGGVYDFWKLQMPFIGETNQGTKLGFDPGLPGIEGKVKATVFLTSMGWSTNLDIHLQGEMTPDMVSKLVSKLSKGGAGNFRINGTPSNLPGVFEYFSGLLHKDVYAANIIDSLKIKRHTIITLSSFTGPVAYYSLTNRSGKQMPAADRALFHSILKGTPVSFADVIGLENPRKFLLTQYYNGPDFALTYFDLGTLLFMQQSALFSGERDRLRSSKMRCHASNIRNYLLMALDLHHFCRDTKKIAETNPNVKALRDAALVTLQDMPTKYTNQFCQSFHSAFGPLR